VGQRSSANGAPVPCVRPTSFAARCKRTHGARERFRLLHGRARPIVADAVGPADFGHRQAPDKKIANDTQFEFRKAFRTAGAERVGLIDKPFRDLAYPAGDRRRPHPQQARDLMKAVTRVNMKCQKGSIAVCQQMSPGPDSLRIVPFSCGVPKIHDFRRIAHILHSPLQISNSLADRVSTIPFVCSAFVYLQHNYNISLCLTAILSRALFVFLIKIFCDGMFKGNTDNKDLDVSRVLPCP